MIWDEIAETVCQNTPSLMDILRNAKDARIGTPIDRWTDEDLSEQLDTVHDDNQRRAVVAALMAIKQGAEQIEIHYGLSSQELAEFDS
jgi:hypothetical protein